MLQPFMDSLIERGDGCYLIDADGRRILDLAAGQFCSILGHNHQGFTSRLKQQLDLIVHLGDQYVSPGILAAASRFAQIAPGKLNKVVFLSTGSEANECAMRMAKTVTGRSGMLAFTRGYYGISLATRNLSSISDHPGHVDFQPCPPGQLKLLTPSCRHCPVKLEYPSCQLQCLDLSLHMISQHLETIAAVIVEPVLSAGGMIFPPADYLQRLYETTRKIGALFIVDEAQTGFGRCGRWFAIENYGIEPDILVVSKTAGNGYPAAAVVVSDNVAKQLELRTFTHLSSHQNDPLAAAAVHAVIDIVEEENLIERSKEMGEYFLDQLRALQNKHSLIADVRGSGLMLAMELADEARSGDAEKLAFETAMMCEERGLHVTFSYYEPVIRFIPPLIVSRAEIDESTRILDEVLYQLSNHSRSVTSIGPQNVRSGPFVKRMNGGFSATRMLRKLWNSSPKQWLEKAKELL